MAPFVSRAKLRMDETWDAAQVPIAWFVVIRHPLGLTIAETTQRVYGLTFAIPAFMEIRKEDPDAVTEVELERTVEGFRSGIAVIRTALGEYWTDIDQAHPFPSWRRMRPHRRLRENRGK